MNCEHTNIDYYSLLELVIQDNSLQAQNTVKIIKQEYKTEILSYFITPGPSSNERFICNYS